MAHLPERSELAHQRAQHADLLSRGMLPGKVSLTLSEALVIGLLRQGVKTFLSVLGHGSTEIGEVLRIYQQAGLVRVCGLRSEIESSHAAAALRWVTGEKAAVVTSIGPGALQALAASIAPASNGIGVWYLLGDETTEDEGYNMQQIPKQVQGSFEKLFSTLGSSYSLHTPLSLTSALHRSAAVVDHPYRAGPFFLLMPMNTQAAWLEDFNLDRLGQIVEGPQLDRVDRVLKVGVAGKDNDGNVGIVDAQILQQLHAPLFGHDHIRENQVESLDAELFLSFFDAAGCGYPVGRRQDIPDQLTDARIIVHHQDERSVSHITLYQSAHPGPLQ
jgi:hypothetical protein